MLIKAEEATASVREEAATRFGALLGSAGVDEAVSIEADFAAVQSKLPQLADEIESKNTGLSHQRDELIVKRGEARQTLESLEAELGSVSTHTSNLPVQYAQVRQKLCEVLGLRESGLPFAAELMTVRNTEREWASSIEKVLRGFALSLLVPEEHYEAVSSYLEQTRITDARGHGQRLVYLKVAATDPGKRPAVGNKSLVRKLGFRKDHVMLAWIQHELCSRFDYECCDTIDEFRAAGGLALTRERHMKGHRGRHEKDDRDRVSSPRYSVLGWRNSEKASSLESEIRVASKNVESVDSEIQQLESQLIQTRSRLNAINELAAFRRFTSIDFTANHESIAALKLEEQTLRQGDDALMLLENQLAAAQSKADALSVQRDGTIGDIRVLEAEIDEAKALVANAQQRLTEFKSDHSPHFDALDECFSDDPLTAETVLLREAAFLEGRRRQLQKQTQKVEPIQTRLMKSMNRFLREFPDERADLDASPEYLESFRGLLDRIDEEDLPRHQQRFKERLNEKVTQEIGFLNGSLLTEATEIKAKVETLNKSLAQMEYRPGTYMRLEPRPVRDREIADFRASIAACLADHGDGIDSEEKRYQLIQTLITRLREEERWRKKVTDVRRWFDFAAIESDKGTGEERSCYTDGAGQSGGEKAKLSFTILVAAIA